LNTVPEVDENQPAALSDSGEPKLELQFEDSPQTSPTHQIVTTPSSMRNKMSFLQNSVLKPSQKPTDAQEEFFKMLCLAFKMNNSKVFPKIMQMENRGLYAEVKKTGKPFYEWPTWVEDTLRRQMLRQKYGYKTKSEMSLLSFAKEVQVVLIDPGYRIYEGHFYEN
jgi:hypothetical protein